MQRVNQLFNPADGQGKTKSLNTVFQFMSVCKLFICIVIKSYIYTDIEEKMEAIGLDSLGVFCGTAFFLLLTLLQPDTSLSSTPLVCNSLPGSKSGSSPHLRAEAAQRVCAAGRFGQGCAAWQQPL
jgi:hypothetical protein